MPFDNAQRPGPGRGTGERAINLPPAVLWLIGINVAVHLVRSLLSDETDSAIILQFGLIPANYTGGGHDLVSQVLSPITYQFLHGGWMHLGINMITLADNTGMACLRRCETTASNVMAPMTAARSTLADG